MRLHGVPGCRGVGSCGTPAPRDEVERVVEGAGATEQTPSEPDRTGGSSTEHPAPDLPSPQSANGNTNKLRGGIPITTEAVQVRYHCRKLIWSWRDYQREHLKRGFAVESHAPW